MRVSIVTFLLRTFTSRVPDKVLVRSYCSRSLASVKKRTIDSEKTLLGRLLAYLDGTYKHGAALKPSDVVSFINKPNTAQVNGLRLLSTNELVDLLYSFHYKNVDGKKYKLRNVLNLLDVECCLRLSHLQINEVLVLLGGFIRAVPNRVIEFKFYDNAINNLPKYLPKLSTKEIIEFIFYVGLDKHSKRSKLFLQKCLKRINNRTLNELSPNDLCIICNSTYRTGMKLNNPRILTRLKKCLTDDVLLMNDPQLLVTFTKTIQHNHFQDEDLLNTITCVIFFNKTYQYYAFATISRLLGLYADYKFYDERLLEFFSKLSLDLLREDDGNLPAKAAYLTEQIRIKDLSSFLWYFSDLGFRGFSRSDFDDVIYPAIMKRVEKGDCKDQPDMLVNMALCMWMLNYNASELIKLALSEDNLKKVKDCGKNALLRFNLLLSCIRIEDEALFKDLHVNVVPFRTKYDDGDEIERRHLLRRAFQVIEQIGPAFELDTYRMHTQISNLNIVGITAIDSKTGKAVQIEVLDEECCVRNQDCLPTGLMLLKLRILNYLKDPLIVISPKEVDFESSELQEFLEDELKLYF